MKNVGPPKDQITFGNFEKKFFFKIGHFYQKWRKMTENCLFWTKLDHNQYQNDTEGGPPRTETVICYVYAV